MTMLASGSFDVKLAPQPHDDDDGTRGRLSIEKQYQGDLEATAKGQMLTGLTDVKNSAGYVAIARVTGSLKGRRGGFLLQHSGTMTRGQQQLTVTIVPDSGSGELKGIAGQMTITIESGAHRYELAYTLPEEPSAG